MLEGVGYTLSEFELPVSPDDVPALFLLSLFVAVSRPIMSTDCDLARTVISSSWVAGPVSEEFFDSPHFFTGWELEFESDSRWASSSPPISAADLFTAGGEEPSGPSLI